MESPARLKVRYEPALHAAARQLLSCGLYSEKSARALNVLICILGWAAGVAGRLAHKGCAHLWQVCSRTCCPHCVQDLSTWADAPGDDLWAPQGLLQRRRSSLVTVRPPALLPERIMLKRRTAEGCREGAAISCSTIGF